MSARQARIALDLHPKQGVALQTTATEVLYGGAAGGGKSMLMRAAAIMWCGMIPRLQVYLFRRLRDDLVKNHIEGPAGLRTLLAPWVRDGFCDMVEDEVRFWNGSKIYLCHCKDEKDRFKYLGAEIHVLLIDELTTFTETIYRFLRSRVRMAGVTLPAEFEGRFPRILCGSNPGNVGHQWVKSAFIDARPEFKVERTAPSEGGMLRQFIPAKLDDNPSVDPAEYGNKLEGLGAPALVKAMRDGDWNVVAGAFFPEFSTERHVVKPRSLPAYWQRFRSFDWGSARPFSVGWWAVSDGELADFPRGALVRYREWYGAARDASGVTIPNQGLRLTAEEVADGIVEREKPDVYGTRTIGGVADPSIFAQNGGPSIGDRMAARKCFFRPADNSRIAAHGAMGGWDQVRARFKGDGERPALYVFDTCRELIRTLPAAQHDEGRPEDLATEGEDHCFAKGTLVAGEFGPIKIEEMPECGLVYGPDGGLHAYHGARIRQHAAPLVRLAFADGSVVTCTPDHEFLTPDGRWVQAQNMLNEMGYCGITKPWKILLSSLLQSKSFKAFDTIFADDTSSVKGAGFTSRFGKRRMVPFLSGIMSTMTATIARSIGWTSSFACQDVITSNFMGPSPPSVSCNIFLSLKRQPRSGTPAKMAGSGTANIGMPALRQSWRVVWGSFARDAGLISKPATQPEIARAIAPMLARLRRAELLASMISRSNASRVTRHSSPIDTPKQRTARALAGGLSFRGQRLGCLAVSDAGKGDAYCLTVPDAGAFLLANGLAVSNCADELRYACLSRPYTAPLPDAATEKEPDRYARKWRPSKGGRGSAMAA